MFKSLIFLLVLLTTCANCSTLAYKPKIDANYLEQWAHKNLPYEHGLFDCRHWAKWGYDQLAARGYKVRLLLCRTPTGGFHECTAYQSLDGNKSGVMFWISDSIVLHEMKRNYE